MKLLIYVECKPDEALIETLLGSKDIIHSYGKARVIKVLSESNRKVMGLVDEDPGTPLPKDFSKNFLLKENYDEFDIKIFKHVDRESYLILLRPRLEEWILKACKEVEISPTKFGLPQDPDKLHRLININISSFTNLLDYLSTKSKRVQKLRHIIASLTK